MEGEMVEVSDHAAEIARTNFRATVIAALLGCVGLVAAAWIGAAVGRTRAQDTAKNTVEQRDTQLAERDKIIAQLKAENQTLRQQIDASAGGGVVNTTTQKNPTSPATQHNEEFAFTLQGCSRKGEAVSCAFSVIAEHRDRGVYLWGTSRLIDSGGKQWLASSIALAGNSHRVDRYSSVSEDLVRSIPVAGSITFEGIPLDEKSAPVIEIISSEGNVQFRNVPVT
jgi:hypothetical protein